MTARLDVAGWSLLGVDMPIGLPANPYRACDREARALIKPRGCCVFPAPPRACLGAPDHATAVRRARAAIGRGLPVQAFHLLPKIAEVDALLEPLIAIGEHDRVIEVHPECSFAMLNGGRPVLAPKRTAAGIAVRRALLAPLADVIPDRPPRGASMDDVLDACAVLLSAERFARGEALVLGDGSHDECGRPMRIVV